MALARGTSTLLSAVGADGKTRGEVELEGGEEHSTGAKGSGDNLDGLRLPPVMAVIADVAALSMATRAAS
jgi:hypothetical protein